MARVAMYLGLGWLGTISALALARRFGVRFILPLVWGGLAYTIGAAVDFLGWPVLVADVVGPHEIFHLAVLAGISFHWAFIQGIASRNRAGACTARKWRSPALSARFAQLAACAVRTSATQAVSFFA